MTGYEKITEDEHAASAPTCRTCDCRGRLRQDADATWVCEGCDPADEARALAIELALPLDAAERVLAYGKRERRAGYDIALTEVGQGIALPATISNRIAAAVQESNKWLTRAAAAVSLLPDAMRLDELREAITAHKAQITAAVVAEREACAEVASDFARIMGEDTVGGPADPISAAACLSVANLIRMRRPTPAPLRPGPNGEPHHG